MAGFFKHESSNRIADLMGWSESSSAFNDFWGEIETIKLNTKTYTANSMSVWAYCGKMDFAYIHIPLSPHSSYSEHYQAICECIFDKLNLKQRGAEMIGMSGVMVLGFSVDWRTITKENLEKDIEILANMVKQFKSELDNFGYCY